MVRMSPVSHATIGGTHDKDCFTEGKTISRTRWGVLESHHSERVWCVTLPSGAFIARRNGKAFVTGNCGRGLRISPGKTDCLILDFAGNIATHGPVDTLNERQERREKGAGGEAPVKVCPTCAEIILAGLRTCPACGYHFPHEVARHAATAATDSALSCTETVEVGRVTYRPHTKDDRMSLRVSYYGPGMTGLIAEEFLAWGRGNQWLDQKAEQWFRQIAASDQPIDLSRHTPLTIIPITKKLRTPSHIVIQKTGKYPVILARHIPAENRT